jgi:hypothetical protein
MFLQCLRKVVLDALGFLLLKNKTYSPKKIRAYYTITRLVVSYQPIP